MSIGTGKILSIRKKVFIVFSLGLVGIWISRQADSYAYVTNNAISVPPDYLNFQPPAKGGSYIDPVFGTVIKRLSDAMRTTDAGNGRMVTTIGSEYSTMTPFNKDNTLLLIQHFSYFALYDGAGNFLRNLYEYNVHASSEPRWSRSDPNTFYFVNGNQLKRFNVGTLTASVVHTFSEYSSISGKGESDISFDGNNFVFAGNNRYVFVYDLANDSKGPAFDTSGHSFDSIYVTPDNNVTITWLTNGSGRFNGIEMFDRNMNFLRHLTHAGGHMDVSRDTNGDEVLLWAEHGDPQPEISCDAGVVKVRLADAQKTCVWKGDWSEAIHVSAPDNSGWFFVETYTSRDPIPPAGWTLYMGELLQVKIDGSEVRRLAHHRSRPFNSYTYMPKVSTSRDGTKIVFGSNYGLQSILGYPSQYSDAYMIDLTGDGSSGTDTVNSTTGGTPTSSGPSSSAGTTPTSPPTTAPTVPVNNLASVVPPIQAGSAQVDAGPMGQAPSGLAIFGYRLNGVLVSEAEVPASAPVLKGRIYAEISGPVTTGFAVANPNSSEATVSFFFTDSNGADSAQGSFKIPPYGQIARFLNQPPFNGGQSMRGTFTFNSDMPVAATALQGFTNERGDFLITTLPIGDPDQRIAAPVFPHFADGAGWSTQFVLVNPTSETISGTLYFHEQGVGATAGSLTVTVDGQSGSSIAYTIPPRSARKLSTAGNSARILVGSAKIVPDNSGASPVGVALLSVKNGGVTVSEAGIPSSDVGRAFRVYAEANTTGSIRTGVAINNVSENQGQVAFELLNLDGTSTGLRGSLGVPGSGQRALFLNEITGLESLPASFKGILRVSSNTDIAVSGLRTRVNERGNLLITSTPATNEIGSFARKVVFPHVIDGGGYTTQVILYSGYPGQPASGNLQLFSQSGGMLGISLKN